MKHKLSINRLILACASLLLASVLFGCTSSNDFEKCKEQLEQQEWKKAVSFPLTVAQNVNACRLLGRHSIAYNGYGYVQCRQTYKKLNTK